MCKTRDENYGAYTVKLGLWAAFAGRFSVSEGNFFPPPRVKSAVIRLDRKHDVLPDDLRRATMVMADAAFATRRKTIANSMKTYFSNPQSVTGTFDQNSSAAIMPEDIVPHIGDLLLQAAHSYKCAWRIVGTGSVCCVRQGLFAATRNLVVMMLYLMSPIQD